MVPIGSWEVILGQAEFVVKGVSRLHSDERVVSPALGRDMKPVDMQICHRIQLIDQRGTQNVPRVKTQRRARNRAVKPQKLGRGTAKGNLHRTGLELHLQRPVLAEQRVRLLERTTRTPTARCGNAIRQQEPRGTSGQRATASNAQREGTSAGEWFHRSPSSRERRRSLYSSVLSSPRAYRSSRISRAPRPRSEG